jgi:hypothetical protein
LFRCFACCYSTGRAGTELWALGVPPTLRLLPVPPYGPELNPVEHLREHVRENYFGKRVSPSLPAVVDCLCQGLNHLGSQPEVAQSLTCFDWIKAPHLT